MLAPLSRLRRGLFVAMAVVAALGLVAECVGHASWAQRESIQKLVAFFSLSYEHNLPTWYSSVLLIACGAALAFVATDASARRAPFARHWWVLAIGFAYMSLDEAVEIHEHLGELLRLHGVLFFSWVVPASVVVLVVLASYVRFLGHLPRSMRRRFVTAGVIYVGGALGMELPLGWWTERHGDENLTYALIDWVEETLEMLGATLFLLAVLDHFATLRARRTEDGPS